MAAAKNQSGLRRAAGSALRRLGVRAEPLDWDPAWQADADPAQLNAAVDVVLPVYGAHDDLRRCLHAVARHTDLTRHRLVVVVDGDPQWRSELLEPLFQAQPDADVLMLENESNLGYVHSVNRGMEVGTGADGLPGRDVVLLNSDAFVTAGWLDGLLAAAASRADAATVTPFSNHGTLCSLPEPWVANPLPDGYDADRFGELVANVSVRQYPCLPTGVGFCLLIRRQALDRVGPFDEAAFGTGYGEETDFCLRALKAGWVNLLDDATFVYHRGEASFGAARAQRMARTERVLARRHPEYVPTIAAFMAEDPLRVARRRVRWRLRSRPQGGFRAAAARRVLHVVHGWPPHNHAGTELYAHTLAHRQTAHRDVAVYARVADPQRSFGDAEDSNDDGVRLRLVVNNFVQRSPLSRNALRSQLLERDFARFVDDFEPDLVHVHHLAGHALTLPRVVVRRGLPLVYQVQDWWALCARANLAHRDGGLCAGPSPSRCSHCLPLTALPGAAVLNPLLYRYRRALADAALAAADAYVMGSRAIESDYRYAGLLPAGAPVYVLPYGVELPGPQPTRDATPRDAAALPLRFGYVGSIQPHKGVHVAVEAFQGISPEHATLDVWGDPGIDPGYAASLRELASAGVTVRGRFDDGQKDAVFAAMDVLLLPSIGLESFGLVAREALARGVPVIASRRGALEDLFPEDGAGGTWIAPGDADGLRGLIGALAADPSRVDEWRRRAPRVVGVDEHVEAIEQVYADVLDGRSRRPASRGPSS